MAFETKENEYIYLSNKNGIQNRYILNLDSTISFIDTAIHYIYTTTQNPISNYPVNIDGQYYIKDNKISEIVYKKKRYHLFYRELDDKKLPELEKTLYKDNYLKKIAKQDSINRLKEDKEKAARNALPDSIIKKLQDTDIFVNSKIDIRNYIFEIEKRYTFDEGLNPVINTPGS